MSGKSGIGTFLDEIIKEFKKSNHEFFLFGGKEGNPCNIKPFSLKESLFFPHKFLKEINACDIYFSPYCNVPSGIKIPIYTTIHDVVFLDVKGLSNHLGILARKFFYMRAVRKSKIIFTVSNFSRERITETLGCKKEKICVVYNGLPSYLEENVSECQKNNTILFIGNIKKHKGLSILLEAFEKFYQIADEKPKLLIVGAKDNFRTKDNSVASKIVQINQKFPYSVEFTGFVEDDKLKEFLCHARILVQPSLYEGFGIPPLQALFCGTKTVISDIPVFKEIYKDFPVIFFKSGDSNDLCEKMALAFRDKNPLGKIPNKYSYKNTANLILSKFEEK